MRVHDLPNPVTASKADWMVATTWIGFTPTAAGSGAHAQCQSTINRQIHNGYVLEYITESLSDPNPGYENHPDYIEERRLHRDFAGRLMAIHKLRPTARHLIDLVGPEEFNKTQDMWAKEQSRFRWSVAFPIVESYTIVERPKARDVFGDKAYRRLYGHASSTLRPLNSDEQSALGELELLPREVRNSWIAVDDEIGFAESSEIDPRNLHHLTEDLTDKVLEGMDAERRGKVRLRAAWLADKFVRRRRTAGTLYCDSCDFRPEVLINGRDVTPRSLLDVHHKNPIALGARYTEERDLSLLCPTCHRFEHRLMDLGDSLFSAERGGR